MLTHLGHNNSWVEVEVVVLVPVLVPVEEPEPELAEVQDNDYR